MKKLVIFTIIIIIIAALTVFAALNAKSIKEEAAETPVPAATPEDVTDTPEPTATPFVAQECCYYLDENLFEFNAEHGSVETVTYTTNGYEKKMQVFLPYGYSEENKYNVLVLMHGTDGNEGYWFGQYQFYDERPIELQNVIDNMIYFGYCEPVIVVSPTFYLNDEEREEGNLPSRDFARTATELENDILPYIKEHYSTYESREHFGFIGASYGSIILYNGVLPQCLDSFSWWGAISGYSADIYSINYALSQYSDDIDIDYFYTSAGSFDLMKKETVLGFNNMLKLCPKITGSNICYTEIIDAEHNGRVWVNGIYNCLLRFFKE